MRPRFIFAALLACLAVFQSSPAVAAELTTFTDTELHYSIGYPEDWERIPDDVVADYSEFISTESDMPTDIVLAVQEPNDDEWFAYPFMAIDRLTETPYTLESLLDFMSQEEGIEPVELGSFEALEQEMSVGESYVLPGLAMIVHTESFYDGEGSVTVVIGSYLGREASVHVSLYAEQDRFDELRPEFLQVLESFAFEEQYRYDPAESQSAERRDWILTSVVGLLVLAALVAVARLVRRRIGAKREVW